MALSLQNLTKSCIPVCTITVIRCNTCKILGKYRFGTDNLEKRGWSERGWKEGASWAYFETETRRSKMLILTTSKQASSFSRTRLYWRSCCRGQWNNEARSTKPPSDGSDTLSWERTACWEPKHWLDTQREERWPQDISILIWLCVSMNISSLCTTAPI